MNHQFDLGNIIQTSLENSFPSNTFTISPSHPQSSSEVVVKPSDQRFTITNVTTSPTTYQLPSSSNSTFKDQSIVLPSNFNVNGGPILCQLDDNSYILIDGLEPTTSTSTTTITNSPPKTAPQVDSTPKQLGNSPTFSVPLQTSNISRIGKVATTPTFTNTNAVQKLTSPQASATKSHVIMNQPSPNQGTTRPTLVFMSNPPSKTSSPPSTNDPKSPVKLMATKNATSTIKPFTNLITTPNVQNKNQPLKYILVPQSNVTTKTTPSIISNSGTSLTQMVGNKPMIQPSKMNLQVSTKHPIITGKIQPPQTVNTKPPEIENEYKQHSNDTQSEADSDAQDLTIIEPPKSPTLFDMTVSDIVETVSPGPVKSTFTYSKISPKVIGTVPTLANVINSTITSTNETNQVNKTFISQPVRPAVVNPPAAQPTKVSLANLPMQYIVPGSSLPPAPPQATPNLKRKNETKRLPPAKKSKVESPKVDETKIAPGVVREVIASRNIQASDKAIINTAVHELKKLFARRELLLKHLNTSCVAMGKVEYKLTISGSPVNVQEMYTRLTNFQQQYETDLKRLDWAVNAMHKLYSELSPNNELRSTEDIIKDLIGPAEGITDDPSAKYEKFKKTTPIAEKQISILKAKPRSPRKPAKKAPPQIQVEVPKAPLEERKVPDKPNPSDGKFHCELCTKVFLKQISLAKHLEFDHPVSLELEKNLAVSRSPKLSHACQECDKSFHSNVMLSIHRSEEHDGGDAYEISRDSKNRRSSINQRNIFSDDEMKSQSEEESKSKAKPKTNARNNRAIRRGRKPIRRTRANVNNSKTRTRVIDSLDFLCDSDATISMSPRHTKDWSELDIFDPDIPIECTDDNPIIPLKRLSEEVIAAYTYSSRR
ncbi:nuclear receptor coactivator 6-like [Panonychus citri]|uniref:nuclear receptor coactivator 6-like n=1 Tax=Panonychus citri TaxID=50023 RepID=UPI002307633A|nr:nuclear receptor coactivator 6-like [Panonychus citri]